MVNLMELLFEEYIHFYYFDLYYNNHFLKYFFFELKNCNYFVDSFIINFIIFNLNLIN